jgi:hypothetical protein
MTTPQFLTLIGILSEIQTTQAGVHGWAHPVVYVLTGTVNLLMYFLLTKLFAD